MTLNLLSQLEELAEGAGNADDRSIYRAQWAGTMARFGRIGEARAEISKLRQLNASYSPRPTAWILIAEGLADHFESLSTNALGKFKSAHAIGVAIRDQDIQSFAAAWLSASEFLVGTYESAVSHAIEAIQNAPSTGSIALSRAHLVLANINYTVALYPEAGVHYAKARHYAVAAHDISMQSAALYNVAAFRIARLSLEDALNGEALLDEVRAAELELASITNLDRGLGVDSLGGMIPILHAQVFLVKKAWSEANTWYASAIPEATKYGQLRWAPRFLAEQSHAQAMLGLQESAAELVARAISEVSDRIDQDDLAACHARLGHAFTALGNEREAAIHASKARECALRFAARQDTQRALVAPLFSIT